MQTMQSLDGGGGGFHSSEQSLDIINYGTGNFNYHLSANNAGRWKLSK